MTPGSTYRPATLQPPCLGREPRLGLRHILGVEVPIDFRIFRERLHIEKFFISLKSSWRVDV
jgi:hypothetical protein